MLGVVNGVPMNWSVAFSAATTLTRAECSEDKPTARRRYFASAKNSACRLRGDWMENACALAVVAEGRPIDPWPNGGHGAPEIGGNYPCCSVIGRRNIVRTTGSGVTLKKSPQEMKTGRGREG